MSRRCGTEAWVLRKGEPIRVLFPPFSLVSYQGLFEAVPNVTKSPTGLNKLWRCILWQILARSSPLLTLAA